MEKTRKQRLLAEATAKREYHAKLVHSKAKGWLTVGLTALALGGVAILGGQPAQVQAATTETTQQVWTLRPVADIVAQIQASNKQVYDIQWGDTLSTISEALNTVGIKTSVNRLAEINRIANINLIYAGSKLSINGTGDNATISVQGPNGTTSFNANPAKGAVATPAEKTAAEQQTQQATGNSSQSTNNGSAQSTGNNGNSADLDKGNNNSGLATTPTTPTGPTIPTTPTTPTVPTTPTKPGEPTEPTKPTEKYATLTIVAKDANGNELGVLGSLSAKIGSEATVFAGNLDSHSFLQGYTLQGSNNQTVKVAGDATISFTVKKNENPVVPGTKDEYVTVNVDEAGNKLADTAGYHKLSESTVNTTTTEGDGTIVTTHTTTAIWHKTVNTNQYVTVNVDQAGNKLASTAGYDEVSRSTDNGVVTTATNGDTTTTYTTTIVYQKHETGVVVNTVNVSEDGTNLGVNPDTNVYHLIKSETSMDGKTITKTWHKMVTRDEQITKNVDESGNVLTDTTGYEKASASDPIKGVSYKAANGDTVTPYVITITWRKSVTPPVETTVTKNIDEAGNDLGANPDAKLYHKMSTSDPIEQDGKKVITVTWHKIVNTDKHVIVNVDQDGKILASTDGYDKLSEKTDDGVVTDTATNGDTVTTITTTVTWKKHEEGVIVKNVTINVDEAGKTLTDTTGYHKISTSDPVESDSTDADGNTVKTYTTTVTWHKVVNTDKNVTVNTDESGKVLASTDGLVKVSVSDPVKNVETAANGDTTTTYTTTVVWRQPTTTEKTVTVDVDESGKAISDTTGYHQLSSSTKDSVETLPNGDTVTTHTVTVVWHLIQNTDKQVTVNVDESGKTLDSTDGYDKVSISDPVKTVQTLDNGDTVTTYTTTVTWKKHTDPTQQATVTVKYVDDKGNKLADDKSEQANVDSPYTATAPAIDGYALQGSTTQTVKVDAKGNTITFTYTKQATPVQKAKVTIIAKSNVDGKVLRQTESDEVEVGKQYTATAPTIDGWTLQGDATQTVTVDATDNTVTFRYLPTPAEVDVNAVASALLTKLNAYRVSQGLTALKSDPNLSAGAMVRAQQEADAYNAGGLSAPDHLLPNGQNFNHEAHLTAYGSTNMAENLTVFPDSDPDRNADTVAQEALDNFKNSPAHNEAMLTKDFTDGGMGVAITKDGNFVVIQDMGGKAADTWDASKFNSKTLMQAGFTPEQVDQIDMEQGFDWADQQPPKFYYIPPYIFKTQADVDAYLDFAQGQDKTFESAMPSGAFVTYVNIQVGGGTLIGYSPVLQLGESVSSLQSKGYHPASMTIPATPTKVTITYSLLNHEHTKTLRYETEVVDAVAGQPITLSAKSIPGFTAYDNGYPLTVTLIPVANPNRNEVNFQYEQNE
ncbi:MucBP domain-containing protein [Schleiferilactobacillus perolens]|uniref:LysM domain-containing protein n=1 Tax=Schleiferilactobacillus perolens DSM 12744 TaxID=1423792 RepID=A0A0R1MW88_9LACO|nr:MucBP domain-containing protein [Schleiferilactobacillus perolens]KRL07880.1 hypothetical protein FD09_GL002021 [Schleiferilactobacillus perolens DSM 12744]